MSAPASNDNQPAEQSDFPPAGTLGYHYRIARALLGDESPGVKLLKSKIDASPLGETERCLADESQVVMLVLNRVAGPSGEPLLRVPP